MKIFHYTKRYIKDLLHLVYPEYCLICDEELTRQEQHICLFCKNELHYTRFENQEEASALEKLFWGRVQIKNTFALLYYKENEQSRKILHQLKYGNKPDLAEHMGELIGKQLKTSKTYSDIQLLIPVPLHPKKRYIRGYNQSEEIAKGISKELNIPIDEKLLTKQHHTESQTKKSKFERWNNVQEVFAIAENLSPDIKHIAIVDDVITTGSTLETAVRLIKEKYQIDVSIISIAYAG